MRKIPDDNLAYPVLVNVGTSTGSGFYLSTSSAIFLVTAKHVLYDKKTNALYAHHAELTSYPKERAAIEKNVMRLDLSHMEAAGEIKTDSLRDIAVIRIGTPDASSSMLALLASTTQLSTSESGIVSVGDGMIRHCADVMVANEVVIFGYPVSLGLPHIPQIDYSRPLLRAGIVAGKNDALGTIILDCPVYPGNSGGLVLEIEQEGFIYKYRAIGVVIEFIPTVAQVAGITAAGAIVNSGYSVAASMDGVLALAEQF